MSTRLSGRLLAGLIALVLGSFATVLLAFSSGANAADYPPPAPSSSVCTPSASSTDCSVAPITAAKTPSSTSTGSTGNLASTGFDVATAVTIVVVLVGVGALCVVAGMRGRGRRA